MIAASSFWSDPASYFAILKVVFGLGLVIFVHELGHFLVAKACGVKCEKFYVGFDPPIKIGPLRLPRTLLKFQWGETEYGIGIIPLGGYVKMLGQDDNPAKATEEIERAKLYKKKLKTGEDPNEEAAEDDEKSEGEEGYVFDPRSYQAKNVPQRMAIISAGVIMNLIFAVIFATIAYSLGVIHTPCEVGGTVGGGPAWEQGMLPGYKIIQIDRDGKRTEHLRFIGDMVQSVVINGDEQDLELLVRRLDGKEVWISVRPSKLVSQIKGANYAKIGMRSTGIPTLLDELPVIPYSSAGLAKAFKGNDVIVAINGKPVKHLYEVNRILTQRPDETLTFTVERKGKEGSTPTKLDIEVAPVRMMRLGVHMKIGCITAVQVNSPAEGKLLPGDLIETVNGEPVGDPFTLGDRLRKLAGQEVVFGIRRNESENTQTIKNVKVTPRQPTILPEHRTADPIAIDEIGVAFRVLNWVVYVEPGSPADVAGIRRGDKMIKLEFVATEKEKKEYEKVGVTLKPIDLKEDNIEWPMVHEYLQDLTSTTKIKLALLRNGQIRPNVDLAWDQNSTWFTEKAHYRPARGFLWQRKTDVHKVGSFGEAFDLGWRQTKEDATRVFRFLKKLIRGEISATNLGGPATIAVVATSEASQGTARLLLFLTLLSANLAIVNFLPIPVLDGGHMLFLLYEGIRGKPPNERVFMALTLVGFAFILGLMLFVIGLDVFRIANWVSG